MHKLNPDTIANESLVWIARQWRAGVHVREEVYAIRTDEEKDAWAARAQKWLRETRAGVAARSPIDAERLDVIDQLPLLPLDPEHPWWEKPVSVDLSSTSSTGKGRPGNNPAPLMVWMEELLNS